MFSIIYEVRRFLEKTNIETLRNRNDSAAPFSDVDDPFKRPYREKKAASASAT